MNILEMNLVNLKKERERLVSERFNAKDLAHRDPSVVAARKKYEEILSSVCKKLEGDMPQKIQEVEARIVELENNRRKKAEQASIKVPQSIQDIVASFYRGVDWGSKLKVIWVSPNERFFILTHPGHATWIGRGMSGYEPSYHYLMRVKGSSQQHGYALFTEMKVKEHEGRLDKGTKAEWISVALELEKTNE